MSHATRSSAVALPATGGAGVGPPPCPLTGPVAASGGTVPDSASSAACGPPASETPPSPAAPREIRLHPRAVELWRLLALLWVAALAALGIALLAFAGAWLAAALVVLLALLLALRLRHYCVRYAARFTARLLPDGLWIDRGVWWRSEIFVPRARIQHTEVNQGPIARRYGIASLKLFTAGTHQAEIEIDGLAHVEALALRDELLGRHGHDAV